jgi:peptide/nickel transport system ATP-binding protein
MRSVPRLDLPRGSKLESIEGLPPDLRLPPKGCRFAPRCPHKLDRCADEPPLIEVEPQHLSACVRAPEILKSGLRLAASPARSAGQKSPTKAQAPLVVVNGLRKHFPVRLSGFR